MCSLGNEFSKKVQRQLFFALSGGVQREQLLQLPYIETRTIFLSRLWVFAQFAFALIAHHQYLGSLFLGWGGELVKLFFSWNDWEGVPEGRVGGYQMTGLPTQRLSPLPTHPTSSASLRSLLLCCNCTSPVVWFKGYLSEILFKRNSNSYLS